MSQPDQPGVITMVQATRLLMLSDERIRQLQKAGYIDKVGHGQMTLVGAVQGYINFLRDAERRSSKSAAASAVQQARAEEINLRVAKERSKLIETDEVEDAISDILGQLRAGFDGLPASVTRDAALRDKIEQKVNGIFERASRTFGEQMALLRGGGAADARPEEDDA